MMAVVVVMMVVVVMVVVVMAVVAVMHLTQALSAGLHRLTRFVTFVVMLLFVSWGAGEWLVLGLEPKRVWGLWGLSGRCGSSCESLGGAAAVQAQGQALSKDPPPAVANAGPIGREGVPAHILGARVTCIPGRRTPIACVQRSDCSTMLQRRAPRLWTASVATAHA